MSKGFAVMVIDPCICARCIDSSEHKVSWMMVNMPFAPSCIANVVSSVRQYHFRQAHLDPAYPTGHFGGPFTASENARMLVGEETIRAVIMFMSKALAEDAERVLRLVLR